MHLIQYSRKMLSRRKKAVLTVLLGTSILYGVLQLIQSQAEYSPLQALSSAESEAQRLLKFMTSYHYHCKSLLHSTNNSDWPMCTDPAIGINPNSSVPILAYSIGPRPDYSFEAMLSLNLSARLLIFLPAQPKTQTPQQLLKLANATIYHTSVVPNDPADFGRNSFQRQTLNSVMGRLGHRRVDVLKVEELPEVVSPYELFYYMAQDGLLTCFRQLHIMMQIDKVDENYLYGWYRTLYLLFHSAGLGLYHTSASSSLCLQVTMMESCRYYMSWLQNPGPQTFFMHPPAVDGSEAYEFQRLRDFLDSSKQVSQNEMISVSLGAQGLLSLSKEMVESGPAHCQIIVFIDKPKSGPVPKQVSVLNVQCSVVVIKSVKNMQSDVDFSTYTIRGSFKALGLQEVMNQYVENQLRHTTVVLVDMGVHTWTFLNVFLNHKGPQTVHQLVVLAPVFAPPTWNSGLYSLALRQRYSQLQRILAFKMTLSEALPLNQLSLKVRAKSSALWRLTFNNF